MAEAAVAASLDLLDADLPGGRAADLDDCRWAVVRSSVSVILARETPASRIATPPVLPPELQPLLRFDAGLRCCFVLRILAGYSNRDCAVVMNLQAEEVETLVRDALMRLCPGS
jgi:hypothetical protein